MRTRGSSCFFLGVLATLLPLLLGARILPQEAGTAESFTARVILDNAVLQVDDKPRGLADLVTVPPEARWVLLKNNSSVFLFLGAGDKVSSTDGWPLGPGEEFSFSTKRPVYLVTSMGTARVRVLLGR